MSALVPGAVPGPPARSAPEEGTWAGETDRRSLDTQGIVRRSLPTPVGEIRIAGTGFELWTDRPGMLTPFMDAHRHFPGAGGSASLPVHVTAGATAPRIGFPQLGPDQVRALVERGTEGRFRRLEVERDGRRLYGDRLLELAPALACGPDGCEVLDARLLAPYLELLLLNAALGRAPDVTAVHAAVIARGGRAALIVGDSGAGKSTLTVALLRRGCAYLSDEVALLDARAGTVRAYPRSLGIRDGARSLLGEVETETGALPVSSLTGDRKWLVDPAAVSAAGVCEEAAVEHVWLLRGFAGAPRIREADPWEAARSLARSVRHQRGAPMERLWTAMELVRRCRAHEIIAGRPDVTAAALVRQMDDG